jgi:hypothetical protein
MIGLISFYNNSNHAKHTQTENTDPAQINKTAKVSTLIISCVKSTSRTLSRN